MMMTKTYYEGNYLNEVTIKKNRTILNKKTRIIQKCRGVNNINDTHVIIKKTNICIYIYIHKNIPVCLPEQLQLLTIVVNAMVNS
jgi:hypothetical protein